MARLYIQREPSEVPILKGAMSKFYGDDSLYQYFHCAAADISEYGLHELIIVLDGKAYAVTSKTFFNSGKRASLRAKRVEDTPLIRLILMKETLLG